MTASRRDELAAGLDRTRARIASACAEVDRSPDEVTLVVVTKFFPASDVRLLVDLGVTDVAENRHQEAQAKAEECRDLAERAPRWHFVGGLQSNKAGAVTSYADVVHSLDRAKLVGPLDRGRRSAAGRSTCSSRSASTRPASTTARERPRTTWRPWASGS